MTPEKKQALIEQDQLIADKGCDGIACCDCVFYNQNFVCHDPSTVSAAFLAGIDFEKETRE